MSVDDVLDPHAQSTRRIIESRLHGEERPRKDHVRVRRGAQPRTLVHLESDAVAQAVHVPFLHALVLADRAMSVRLEEIADVLLVDAARCAHRQPVHGSLHRVLHEGVQLL